MKKLLYFLLLSNALALGSEYKYTKDTCNRSYGRNYGGRKLSTDEERKACWECDLSRIKTHIEIRDEVTKEYIADITYKPSKCYIKMLFVAKKHRNQGIGETLVKEAIKDMHDTCACREVYLYSTPNAEKFYEKLGAEPRGYKHIFSVSTDGTIVSHHA